MEDITKILKHGSSPEKYEGGLTTNEDRREALLGAFQQDDVKNISTEVLREALFSFLHSSNGKNIDLAKEIVKDKVFPAEFSAEDYAKIFEALVMRLPYRDDLTQKVFATLYDTGYFDIPEHQGTWLSQFVMGQVPRPDSDDERATIEALLKVIVGYKD